MKKMAHLLTFSLIAATLLTLWGCDKEEVLSHGGNRPKGNTFSVEVLMPTTTTTKVTLSETGNISLEWKEGDKLNFLFIADEGAILEVLNNVPVIIDSEDSRRGRFNVDLPATIEGQFSLGVFYGAEPVVEGGQVLLTLAAPTGGASLSDVEESFIMGSMKNTQVGEAPTLQFEVLSSIVGVMVANESDAPIENRDSFN